MTKRKLYSYMRWSSDRQEKGTTLERQLKSAETFAAQHDLEIVKMIDEGVSGYRGKNLKPEAASRS